MDLLIVTGMSGSGKSSVMDVMEDIGYYCIDNIPPKLIPQFVDLCRKSDSAIDRIAVAVDIRTGDMFAEIFRAWQSLKTEPDVTVRVLFIEADDEVIVKRYKETRRKHPLDEKFNGNLHEAIQYERNQLSQLREVAERDRLVAERRVMASRMEAMEAYRANADSLHKLRHEVKNQYAYIRMLLERGDYQKALEGDDTHRGLLSVIDNYGSTKAGNLAKYYAGIANLQLGNYDEAGRWLAKYKGKDTFTKPIALMAQADALVEQGNTEAAAKKYVEAAQAGDNAITAPSALFKAGMAYLMLNNNAKALECLKQIKSKYPESTEAQSPDTDKLIAIAEN